MAKPIRETTKRWWFDRHGTLWINVRAVRRKPITAAEWKVIDKIVDERGDDHSETLQ